MPSDANRSGGGESSLSGHGQESSAQQDELQAFLNEKLDGYEILGPIGQGGQAFVFEAYQKSTDRIVALKVLKEGPLSSEEKRMRFEREATIVSRMSHPNIIRVYDKGTVAGHQWISMEYIERGLPLDDYLALHRPSIREAVRIFERIVRVVSVAHQHGIIHRDLKPGNILMDAEGNPHIADFGLAKDLLDSSDALFKSETGQVVGTPPYLSPEQVAQSGKAVSTLSDVYSLGVTFYQMLTGVFPYPVGLGVTPEQARESILNREPMRMREGREQSPQPDLLLEGDLSDDLEQVILKALRKEPDRRYESAAAFADDLGRYVRGEAVGAKAERRLYVIWRFLMRHRRETAVVAAFIGLLVGALVGTTALWLRAERVSRLSQFVWDTHALNKLGGVARDEGRYEDAFRLFERSLEISDMTDIPDPTLLRHRFQTCLALAWVCHQRGDAERGEQLLKTAKALVTRMRTEHPEDLIWRRASCQVLVLEGRNRFEVEQWEPARELFEQACDEFGQLCALNPSELSWVDDHANSARWVGRCHMKLKDYRRSQASYQFSNELLRGLVTAGHETGDRRLNIIRGEIMIARGYLKIRTPQDDAEAERILLACQKQLAAIEESGDCDGLTRVLTGLQRDVREHLKAVRTRAAERGATEDSSSE